MLICDEQFAVCVEHNPKQTLHVHFVLICDEQFAVCVEHNLKQTLRALRNVQKRLLHVELVEENALLTSI